MKTSKFMVPHRYMSDALVTASGEVAGFGAPNVLDPDRTQIWRAPVNDGAYLDFDLGEPKALNGMVVLQHSLAHGGSFGLWASQTGAGESEVLSQEIEAWTPFRSLDELDLDEHNLDGYLGQDEIERYMRSGTQRFVYLDRFVARYLRLYFHGPTWSTDYNPARLVEAGLVAFGSFFQSDVYVTAPVQMGPASKTKHDEPEEGGPWIDVGNRYRVGKYNYDYSDESMVVGPWYDLLEDVGLEKPFFADFFPEADSPALELRNQLYCILQNLTPLTGNAAPNGGVTLDVREYG